MDTSRTVTDHLLDRLVELGVAHVFGVPGDFTLGLLDHLTADPRLEWVGTASELGAGYAADGYARVRGFGVVCTTFGVGELSAINAVAGSHAERVPVLHLVGAPSTRVQAARRATHHSLGDGDFAHTLRMSREVTVAQAALGPHDAVAEIDRVLAAILATGRPGYLSLPTDVAELPVGSALGPLVITPTRSDELALRAFTTAAEALLARTTARPVVLADIMVSRSGAERALHRLLAAGDLDYASLLWGRRVIDESGAGFRGTYIGAASDPAARAAVETAPCLVTAGVTFTDLISGFFSERLDPATRIDLTAHEAVVGDDVFPGVEMADALDALAGLVAPGPAERTEAPRSSTTTTTPQPDGPLTQAALWDAVAAALQPGDLVVADQGTAFYGLGGHRLPSDVLLIGQPLWASIGYTLPALLGAALGDHRRRPVLLIGDGAAQLTIQELGTIIRHRIPAVIVVVDNDGYTVERAIRGATASYNDIASWRWAEMPHAMGADPTQCTSVRVDTASALRHALVAAAPDRLTFVQAVTPRLDVPPLLEAVARAAAAANAPTPDVAT
jgi:TPP-dependent 2-oxoacid decarboxylase